MGSAPKTIGFYNFIKKLEDGAQGICSVYENRKDDLKTRVVIKMVKTEIKQEQLAEAQILQKCSHPFVVGLYESFIDGPMFCIVMQYAEGGSLGNEIQQRKQCNPRSYFSEHQIFTYFAQITMALEHLHYKNVIHRDLKPENILLNRTKSIAKLADFGISKIIDNNNEHNTDVRGTCYYMPPEVINGASYGIEVDIWALGCVLYEMYELERTFAGSNAIITTKINKKQFHKPTQSWNEVLETVFTECLSIDPHQRPTIERILKASPILSAVAQIHSMVIP